MAVARHGRGAPAVLAAYASQIHPVFMLPPLATAAFGAVLAGRFELLAGGLHLTAIFLAVYTAHVKDGLVDFHGRGEDDDHPLTVRGCRLALVGSSTGFFAVVATLAYVVDPIAVLLTLPGWVIGYLHAPQLDTIPLTATAGYPTGIALSLLGGFYVQAGALSPAAVAFATIFLLVLAGVKIVDDAQDRTYDRSINKRTVAVVLGYRRARSVASALMGAGMVAVFALVIEGILPPGSVFAIIAFATIAVISARAPPELATKLLIRGSYVFLALLVAAVWFRPLAGVPLPDIGVLGRYTYLATEVAFGSVAAFLLWRSGAWWPAARTVLVLYPVAYVWDWYTLEVGVFAIPLRTGVEFGGIPLEEHLFMIIVPAFVVAVHETLKHRDAVT